MAVNKAGNGKKNRTMHYRITICEQDTLLFTNIDMMFGISFQTDRERGCEKYVLLFFSFIHTTLQPQFLYFIQVTFSLEKL